MSAVPSRGEMILYRTKDGREAIRLRVVDGTVWLTQAEIAALFDTTPQNVTQHLGTVFGDGELDEAATCKDFLQVSSRAIYRWRSATGEPTRRANGGTGEEDLIMPLTISFRETVQARANRDVKFRQALLGQAMQVLLDGYLEEGRSALRSCINATIGFEKLGAALGRSPKSLMRMFGLSGNPTAENLFNVIGLLQAATGVRLQVRAVADAV